MKAIIIEEARFGEFVALLDGEKEKIKTGMRRGTELLSVKVLKSLGVPIVEDGKTNNDVIPAALYDALVDQIHREMRYEFVRWAQAQGASCVR